MLHAETAKTTNRRADRRAILRKEDNGQAFMYVAIVPAKKRRSVRIAGKQQRQEAAEPTYLKYPNNVILSCGQTS
ncbi:MAG: hypothetical protein P4M13_09845 [Alphaproteobacteria bacterium]|nr:hypothetical protein [Alphaproteobacteria bacterium]